MANQYLKGSRIAILATDGFEQSELLEPRKALEEAGAQVDVISPNGGSIKGWSGKDWGKSVDVDITVADADADDYAALMLPGGVINPDKLRIDQDAVQFAQKFVDARKPIAAICHGPQLLIETGIVKGRQLTSWPSLRTDLINAGAHWVDEEVVTDQGLVTSRKPDDIPAFNKKMIEEFREGVHDRSSRQDRSESMPTHV